MAVHMLSAKTAFVGLVVLGGASFVPTVFAQDVLPPVRDIPTIRGLGLGISPVALSGLSHGESWLANPAWIGQEGNSKKKGIVRGVWFPNASVGANGTTRALARAYFGGQSSTKTRLEDFLKAAQNEQTPFGLFALEPGLTLGPVHWGTFARVRVEGFVWQPTTPATARADGLGSDSALPGVLLRPRALAADALGAQMQARATTERGTSLSMSVPYKNTGVFLGVTVRPSWRSEYFGAVELSEPLVSTSATQLRAKFNETRGIPIDAGMAVRLARLPMKPSFGLKIEDVADTRYTAVNAAHQSVVQKSNLSAGAAAWMMQSSKFASQCSLAGHHLNDRRFVWKERLGMGCEFHVLGQVEGDVVHSAPLIVRVGVNQEGLAYGLSWDTPLGFLEVASSGATVDGPTGQDPRRDRRYFLRLTVDANQQ